MDNKIPTINDENNNCTNCEYELNSDDEYSYSNDSEFISIDTRKLWHDIAHIIKCIYRETNAEFSENHSLTDLSQAKEYVEILTQSNPECLFNKIESIVLEYVDEIRNQVLKRSQTYLKTSNDVQLFISYLLDEYNTFIQAAKNVSTIVKYLEESYMKKFHLTWLLYNKHLYEKLVYMDKKIQQSMSIMIDLLQPSNEINNDYSPAEYTKLLNRFLAFDEEMSEIACLYKDSQMRNSTGIIVKKTRKEIKVEEPKKTKSTRRTNPPKSEIILPPKPPLKLQNPLTIPAGPSLLSAKIQSVSFTAGTFGSITTANHPRLNLNLSKTKSSTIACNNLDQLLRQAASPNEISSLLSSLQSSKPMEDLSKEKTCDFCCCDLFSESSNNCLTCMSLANSVNQRENETKKRLKLKINTRTEQTTSSTDQSKPNIGTKPSDNNIDDLVRFIDGNQSTPNELITKKTKKKKKSTTKNSTKRKETIEEEEKPDDQPVVMKPIAPPRVLSPPKEVPMESPMSPEEEVNWITISRKQSKHKTTTVPSLLAVPVNPPNNSKQKRPPPPPTTTVKTKTQAIAQPKMVSETVINSDKQPIVNTSPSARAQNTTKTQQKSEIPSAWTNNHEPVQGMNLFFDRFCLTKFFYSSSNNIHPSCNSTRFCSIE